MMLDKYALSVFVSKKFFYKNIKQVKAKVHPSLNDMEKVQSTLKQIVRDWSKDGEEERAACYDPIIQEIEANFPPDQR